MEMNEWRPLRHWLQVFGHELSDEDIETLQAFSSALARDPRFKVTGCARAWITNEPQWLYCPSFVTKLLNCLTRISKDFHALLRAMRGFKKFATNEGDEWTQEYDSEDGLLERSSLSDKQKELAWSFYWTVARDYGFSDIYICDDACELRSDRGLLRTGMKIACKCYPTKKRDQSKRVKPRRKV